MLTTPQPTRPVSAASASRRATAVGLVVTGALSVQFGAAIAVLLFPRAGALGVVTLRLVISAVLLLAVCRPAVRGRSRGDWLLVVAFGATLAALNATFYEAIARIPLGTTVTLEVLGPLALSVLSHRRPVAWLWAALALAGVAVLGGGLDGLNMVGLLFTFVAAILWATYIVLSSRTGQRFPGADGLALAMTVAALLITPLGVISAGSVLLQPSLIGAGAAVAVLSSMVPYTLELFALRTLPASTFAVLVSLGPAIAALSGYLILGQALTFLDLLAMVLVIGACVGAVLTAPATKAATSTELRQERGTPIAEPGG